MKEDNTLPSSLKEEIIMTPAKKIHWTLLATLLLSFCSLIGCSLEKKSNALITNYGYANVPAIPLNADSVHGWVGYYIVWKPENWRTKTYNSHRDSALYFEYEPAVAVYDRGRIVGDNVKIADELLGIFIYHDFYESLEQAEERGHAVQKRIGTELQPFDLKKPYVFIADTDVYQFRELINKK
jgi:hypothetical protein